MRSVCYSVAMSLDGYIAGPGGEFDWIVMDPDMDFMALLSRFDTVLLGRKTWEAMQTHGGPGMPGLRTVVFSKTLEPTECSDAELSDSPEDTVATLRMEDGKDIWLFGGGALFRCLLDAGLVDVVEIAVVPVLLGGGIPMLQPGELRKRLNLKEHKIYPRTGTVWLRYEPA